METPDTAPQPENTWNSNEHNNKENKAVPENLQVVKAMTLTSSDKEENFSLFPPLLKSKLSYGVFFIVAFGSLLSPKVIGLPVCGWYFCIFCMNIVKYFWKRKSPLKAFVALVCTLLVMMLGRFYYEKYIIVPEKPIQNRYLTTR